MLESKYNFSTCHLKGDTPDVTLAFIVHPLTVMRSLDARKKISSSQKWRHEIDLDKQYSKLSIDGFLSSPPPNLPKDINYLCKMNTPWIDMVIFIDGGMKRAHVVINWSERQIIYDQFILHGGQKDNELKRIEFYDDFSRYIDKFNSILRLEKSRDKLFKTDSGIPSDLVWLFSNSPNAGWADSSFPDIDDLIDKSKENYAKLIIEFFGACYESKSHKLIEVESILEAGEYVDPSFYKIDRPIKSEFLN